MLVQPYWGAVGVSQGSTKLLMNGSSAHSETSWLRGSMSCNAQFEMGPKKPGVTYDAHAQVCTGWLPLPFCGPLDVCDGTGPAPWKPITQQFSGLRPMNSITLFVR